MARAMSNTVDTMTRLRAQARFIGSMAGRGCQLRADGTSVEPKPTELLVFQPGGTPFADRLEGRGGDDELDGGSGVDTLSGGEGMDRYVLGYGTGRDTVIEAAGQASVIELAPGISFANVRAGRSGDALTLTLRGTSDSLTLADYFTAPGTWMVKKAGGASRSANDLYAPSSMEVLDREALKEDARIGARARLFAQYLAQGLKPVDGTSLAATEYLSAKASSSQNRQTTRQPSAVLSAMSI